MRHSPASPEAAAESRRPSMRRPGSPVASCWSGCCSRRSARLGAALAIPVLSLGPAPGKELFSTAWGNGQACSSGSTASRCSPNDLPIDAIATVFPEGAVGSADSQTLLIHVPPEALHLPPEHAELGARGLRRVLEGLHPRGLSGRAVSGERADAHLPVPPVDVRRPGRRDPGLRASRPAAARSCRSRSSPTGRSWRPATSPTPSARASGTSRDRMTDPRRAPTARPSSTASSPGSTSGQGSRP